MGRCTLFEYVVVVYLSLTLLISNAYASKRDKLNVSISPIANIEHSLTASAAHGTIVAISCGDGDSNNGNGDGKIGAVVIVSQNPSLSARSNLTIPSFSRFSTSTNDSSASTSTAVRSPCEQHGEMLHILSSSPSGLVVGMTGFSPDISHLISVTKNMMLSHEHIYDNCMPVQRLVKDGMSSYVKKSSDGERPFGVQGLIVGRLDGEMKNNAAIYTIDPSGGYRFWGSGMTAIGRNAENIRKHIVEEINLHGRGDDDVKDGNDVGFPLAREALIHPKNSDEALELAIKCILKADKRLLHYDNQEYDNNSKIDPEPGSLDNWKQFDAIVVSTSCNRKAMKHPVMVFNRETIKEVYNRVVGETKRQEI